MEVTYIPLKKIVSLVIDYRGKTPLKLGGEWSLEGYRALSALNVKTRGLVAEDKIRYVNQDLYNKWMKEEVHRGDILITSEAPFGQVLQWNSEEKIVLSQRLFALRIKSDYCASYIYQYMASDFFYGELKARATDSTVEGLRQPALMKCKVAVPSLPIQRRIASILSIYDDLIEKNNRKIAISQEMAEGLYKEWFVRFRFPGYKTAKFKDGIPEGWTSGRIEDLGSFTRGKNITADEMIEGNIPVISAGIEPSGFHCESNVKGVSITISSSGANAGYMRINYSDIWAADCSFVNNVENIFYMYELLNNIRPFLDNLQKGAAQPHVYAKDVNRLKIVLPKKELRTKFNEITKGIHLTIATLQKQNENLTQQRDLLLPRLMSGKLEVKA